MPQMQPRTTGVAARAAVLNNVADEIEENVEMLAVAESYENGNPGARDARRHPATARPFRYAAVRSAPRTVGSPRTELEGSISSLALSAVRPVAPSRDGCVRRGGTARKPPHRVGLWRDRPPPNGLNDGRSAPAWPHPRDPESIVTAPDLTHPKRFGCGRIEDPCGAVELTRACQPSAAGARRRADPSV
jgi:hypothetical protein